MKKLIIGAFASIIFSSAFAQKSKTEKLPDRKHMKLETEYTTASGLKYMFKQFGKGAEAKVGSNVSVHYIGRLADGKTFDSSRDRNQPITFKLGEGRVIKGWDEGIALMHVGDRAVLTIPPSIGYGSAAQGPIPANSTLFFDVELMGISEPVKPWTLVKHDTISLPSGLKYIVVEKSKDPNSPKAEKGKIVNVHYTGFLKDGKIFDSSVDRGEPISFPLGQGQVIKGWDEGIALMQVGDKMRLVIPYNLAYGDQGVKDVIPPYSTLIFDVELVGIK